ncbi:hypothetical protein M446_5985 [Methylobacterium sp. 4-46]|nr:hypothetical protein M446_5985 [Methylobacterium sp. 4-46]
MLHRTAGPRPAPYSGRQQNGPAKPTEAAMRERIEDLGFIIKIAGLAMLGSLLTSLFA